MKIFALVAVGCVLIGLAMGFQAGLFDDESSASSGTTSQTSGEEEGQSPKPKHKGPRARYPDALVEVVRGKPAPTAAEYHKSRKPHRLVFFDTQGRIHEWQEKVPDEWQAESVEGTELVVVVGRNHKLLIQYVPFHNAPAISRYRHDMDVYVRAAKTGELLAKKPFISMPRAVEHFEAYEITALGGPVQFKSVFDWIVAQCPLGFPQDPSPVITLYKNN